MNRWWLVAFWPALVFLALGPPASAAEKQGPAGKKAARADVGRKFVLTAAIVVKLEEVSAFGKERTGGPGEFSMGVEGQHAGCRDVPDKQVKAYPKLRSKRPLYGSVTFDSGTRYDPKPGITYHFVLDESGEEEKLAAGKERAKTTVLGALAKSLASSMPFYGRSHEKPCTYDRLYFDFNGDGDLTNDGVVRPAEKPLAENMPVMFEGRDFQKIKVPFDFGAPLGKRPLALVPRLQLYEQGHGYVEFVPAMARKGNVSFGGEQYEVWLSQSEGTVSGRFDGPYVEVHVFRTDPSSRTLPLLKSGPLGEMRFVGGQYLTLSASPLGDTLTIAPYRGDLGVLQIGAGGRAITDFGAAGQLAGRTVSVPLGDAEHAETLPRRYEVPVGDYLLSTVTARCGRLRFRARNMFPTDEPDARRTDGRRPVYPIHIRKDKPFVLEFSGKPNVTFMNPDKTERFSPGDNVNIEAMLNEPWQGIQITGLWDATKKQRAWTASVDGQIVTVPQFAELDPTIVIRNASGEEVASGKMPFG